MAIGCFDCHLFHNIKNGGIVMRLFIAINFKENEKKQIQNVIREIEKNSIQGRFVKNEHMHLTLEFLGEVTEEKVPVIKNAIKQITFEPFTMNLSSLGYFKRRQGDIYWLGIEHNDTLFEIQARLHDSLIREGFELENRPYKPHITIGRKVKMKENFSTDALSNRISGININVDKVDLMKSEFINGKLAHSIIYTYPDISGDLY